MEYTVARKNKATGKYEYYGQVALNQYGKLQLELKNNAEFRAALEEAGDGRRVWLNLFEKKDKPVSGTTAVVGDNSDTPF